MNTNLSLSRRTARVFVPDGASTAAAAERTRVLGVGAHQDDLEFMALHGIARCYGGTPGFSGVTCTDGTGSVRAVGQSRAALRDRRREEQNRAAKRGRYSMMIQLDFPTPAAAAEPRQLTNDLLQILALTRPRYVYTHNPADKHPTHLAVLAAVVQALRALPVTRRPRAVYGCEVWRGLDWLPDREKIVHDLSGSEPLARALSKIFSSQLAAKRYDLAVAGRRRANATFLNNRAADRCSSAAYAMDLTPLMLNPKLSLADFAAAAVERFKQEVVTALNRLPL